MLWWECLQIPAWRYVFTIKNLLWQEAEARALETRGHDDHIPFDDNLSSRTTLRNSLGTMIESHSFLCEAEDVSSEPLGIVLTNLLKDVRIHHGRSGEETFDCGAKSWRSL